MIYSLTLGTAFLLAGALLLLLGALGLALPAAARERLLAFPRSRVAGAVLLTAAAAWAWLLIYTIDLGEFEKFRTKLLYLIPAAGVLTLIFVEELLAVRALGMLVLLAAEPLLEAAFLRPEGVRLFLVTFTYIFIVAGMFWIGMPYVLRDHLRWITASGSRLRGVAGLMAGYGLVLVILGLTLHR